jgi:adenylyl cyclase-associated protein
VTARLEDIATAAESSGNAAFTASDLGQVLSDTIWVPVAEPAPSVHPPPDNRDVPESLPRCIEEFDNFLEKSVAQYVQLSDELGGTVAEQARAVLACFQEQRKILLFASKTAKPNSSDWETLLHPMKDAAARVVEIQETSPFDNKLNHLSCVSDGIPVLGWIQIEMSAYRHVDKFLGYAQYFGNKVTKEYKDKLGCPLAPPNTQWMLI